MAGRCGGRNGIGENSPEAPRSEHELSGPGPQAGGGEEEEQIRGMRLGRAWWVSGRKVPSVLDKGAQEGSSPGS